MIVRRDDDGEKSAVVSYDPSSPAVIADPYPSFRELQDRDPVHRSPVLKAWVVTRSDDVKRVITEPEFSSDRISPFRDHMERTARERVRELLSLLGMWTVFVDPPRHTRLRGLVATAFVSRNIEGLRPEVQAIVDRLLDAAAPRGERWI